MEMDLEQWMEYGWQRGYCGPPVCYTHDGIPLSGEEIELDEEYGGDYCVHVLRLYDGYDQAVDIETNHSPTVWRASNRGWRRSPDMTQDRELYSWEDP